MRDTAPDDPRARPVVTIDSGPEPAGGFRSVLRNRRFRRVLTSDAFSGTGDVLYWIALIVWLLERDPDGSLVAAAVAVRLIPRVAFGAFGGVVADRYDRRLLLMSLDGSRAVLMFALAAVVTTQGPTAMVLGVVFVTCSLSTPYRPAISSGYPLLLRESDLAPANALSSTVGQVSALSGPLLGALLLTIGPPSWAFIVNGATYVMSLWLLAGVSGLGSGGGRTSAPDGSGSWFGLLSTGLRAARSQPGVAGLLLLIASVMSLRGFELVLYVQAAEDVLGLGASGYGLMSGALGAGALAAAPFTSRLAGSTRPGHVLVGAALVGCAPLVLLSMSDSTASAMITLGIQGASIVCFEVVALTMLQRACDSDVLGRVLGLQNTLSGSAKLAGSLCAPALVVAVGLRHTLLTAALITVLLAALLARRVFEVGRASGAVRARLEPFVSLLSRLDVFEGAERPAIELLAMNIARQPVETGTRVITEDEAADDFFIVESGAFAVERAGIRIETLGPEDCFGEIGLLRRAPRMATVEAIAPSVVWRIPGDVFLAAVTSSATLPGSMMDMVEARLARSDAAQGVVSRPPIDEGDPGDEP